MFSSPFPRDCFIVILNENISSFQTILYTDDSRMLLKNMLQIFWDGQNLLTTSSISWCSVFTLSTILFLLRCELLTATVKKSSVFCDITQWNLVKSNWHFSGTHQLTLMEYTVLYLKRQNSFNTFLTLDKSPSNFKPVN